MKDIRVEHGDSREVLRTLDESSVDSCVTDPPYALTSIVKRFGATNAAPAKEGKTGAYARASRGFMGKTWDTGDTAFDPDFWAEVLRTLKPGAHLLAFGGTRAHHRMFCAIEDAGFEIRDCMSWLYGSGFPKSHNQHDEWEGWGTALKPAWEPICVARKPLIGSVAKNLAAHGTGAINVDGCRVFGNDEPTARIDEAIQDKRYTGNGGTNLAATPGRRYKVKRFKPRATLAATGGKWKDDDGPVYEGELKPGRWPANVIHDGSAEVEGMFPEAPGQQRGVGPEHGAKKSVNTYGDYGPRDTFKPRFDEGTAARFFYSAKADAEDRCGSKHPTVKPIDLMAYLCRLVTPPGGTVLDPFAGSGSTGMACLREGFNAILIERESEYIADIRRRIDHVAGTDTPLFSETR